MKDIKSFLIGFLSCACMILLMGATSSSEQGKYQAFGDVNRSIIDTHTGQFWSYNKIHSFWEENVKPNQFYESVKAKRKANK